MASAAAPTADIPPPPLPDIVPDPPPVPGRAKNWPSAANLGVVAELRGAPMLPAIATAGNLVLTASVGESAIHRLPEARSSVVHVAPEVSPVAGAPQRDPFAALGLSIATDGEALVAFDVRGRRRRWSVQVWSPAEFARRAAMIANQPGDGRFMLTKLLTSGTTLIAVLEWVGPVLLAPPAPPYPTEIVAIEASRGAILWRRPLDIRSLARDHVACADGRVHIEQERFGVVTLTLDAASGRTLWEVEDEHDQSHEGPAPEAADGQLVSIHKTRGVDRDLVTRDAASGRVIARRPLPAALAHAEIAAMRLAAGSLYAIVEESHRARLVALDPRTARPRWESAPIEYYMGLGERWLGLDDDAVFACLPDGVLRAFDPKRGAILWHHGVGQCMSIALARPDPAGPATIIARSFALTPRGPDDLGTQRLLVFARGAAPAPIEHATFEGMARPGARIRVGTTMVTADAKGLYRAVVDARGVVSVEGLILRGMVPIQNHLVELDGRRSYKADLEYIDSGP